MAVFQKGWYLMRISTSGIQEMRHFEDEETVTASCWIEADGGLSQWWDVRAQPPAKKIRWLKHYVLLPSPHDVSHWDDYRCTLGSHEAELPPQVPLVDRKETIFEKVSRMATVDHSLSGPECIQEIHVGIFFDGTNNNMERDKPVQGHSNIVSLFDAHQWGDDKHFRFYIPGVGTAFKEIGELEESSGGKTFARGGEARIHWAMLQVYNAVCSSFYGHDLLGPEEMKTMVTEQLSTFLRLRGSDREMKEFFTALNKRLLKAINGKRPRIVKLNLSVFGFSRGAAEARAFSNWIQLASGGLIGEARLNMRFMGLFDTVASVGLADSSPVGRGFFHWAHNNLDIKNFERAVHYIAGHEIRRSFPVSTVRDGGDWPANTREFVYPGAHSDIGGGYGVGEQGKSSVSRNAQLSQIPLNDMYHQARAAGVYLVSKFAMDPDTHSDFTIDPDLAAAFTAYTAWTTDVQEQEEDLAGTRRGVVASRMHTQMQYYWRWRASKKTEAQFKSMACWGRATAQEQQDLWESELDWQKDIEQACKAHVALKLSLTSFASGVGMEPEPSQTQKDLVVAVDNPEPIPPLVDKFFDEYVHDSHAGFWLLGPTSAHDQQSFVVEIQRKKANYDRMMELSRGDDRQAQEYAARAGQYELNSFEQRVFDAHLNTGGPQLGEPVMPLMTDADASDLRGNMGMVNGLVVQYIVGSSSRREANGSGQYRRVFDRANELTSLSDELLFRAEESIDKQYPR